MKIRCDSQENLEKEAIQILEESIKRILEKKETVLFGIPGGNSVKGIFESLNTFDISWEKVHFFWIDERLADPGSDDSNFKLASDFFLADLLKSNKIPSSNIHPIRFNDALPDFGASEYEKEFLDHGTCFDIVLMGAGEDGHIASLFPEHFAMYEAGKHFMFIENAPKFPECRISASPDLLLRSNVGITLFFGSHKKEAAQKCFDSSLTVQECPAKIALELKDSYILIDEIIGYDASHTS